MLAYVESSGEMAASAPLPVRLPDPDDEPFLEAALASRADCLVTGNLSHFPPSARSGIAVLTPAELIDRYRETLADLEAGTAGGET